MWHSGGGEDNWLYSMAPSKGIIVHPHIASNRDDNHDMMYTYIAHFIFTHGRVPIRRHATLGQLEISSL